jgi:hypothetical protein
VARSFDGEEDKLDCGQIVPWPLPHRWSCALSAEDITKLHEGVAPWLIRSEHYLGPGPYVNPHLPPGNHEA